jgi:aryl-alcohol dehydrogenase-like predicted oxidoreductase
MNYRPLGSTGIYVSEIGFGAWGIGGWSEGELSYGHVSEKQALEAINAALDHGITFFDSSPLYGLGRSELLIGQATNHCRDRVVIATKVGLENYQSAADFTPKSMRRSLEGTLRRLGTDYVDLLQLHDPDVALLRRRPEILETLESFKDAGKIRAYGISVRSPQDGVICIQDYKLASVQVNFNMLDQRALECGLFDAAELALSGLIVRTPLCLGFLAGDFDEEVCFPPEDHRSRWGREQVIQWVRGANAVLGAARETGEKGTNIELALRYCLSFKAVASVIPGPLNGPQAIMNANASQDALLSNKALQRIRQTYLETELSARSKIN